MYVISEQKTKVIVFLKNSVLPDKYKQSKTMNLYNVLNTQSIRLLIS
jgi:hypothetical protein